MATRSRRPRADVRTAATPAPIPPLYHHSVRLFTLFALAMLVAFWPSYFSRLAAQPTYHPHAHGIAMTLWCGLLIAQATLIRSGRRALHRQLGLVSYLLVPIIVVVTINFLHFRVRDAQDLGVDGLFFVTLVLNALVAFVALFALAMVYRKTPAVHARFMVSTIFPLFTPVTDRLIGRFWPSLLGLMPRIDGSPVVQCAGFALADALLVGLSIWDWRTNRRRVFPIALGVVVLYQASVLTFYRFGFWQAFGAWFVAAPLS